MSKERRKYERHQPSTQHMLYYADSDEVFGHIGNASQGGFLALTENALEENAVVSLQMRLLSNNEVEDIPFAVSVLWQSPASTDNSYWTGLQIIEINNDNLERLGNYLAPMQIV